MEALQFLASMLPQILEVVPGALVNVCTLMNGGFQDEACFIYPLQWLVLCPNHFVVLQHSTVVSEKSLEKLLSKKPKLP